VHSVDIRVCIALYHVLDQMGRHDIKEIEWLLKEFSIRLKVDMEAIINADLVSKYTNATIK